MRTPAPNGGPSPAQPGPLPNGLYVVEDAARDLAAGWGEDTRGTTWRITGRNPQFWWDIVLTDLGADAGGFELHCTRCGHRDHAPAIDDVLRLIRAGAHCHDTSAAGGS